MFYNTPSPQKDNAEGQLLENFNNDYAYIQDQSPGFNID